MGAKNHGLPSSGIRLDGAHIAKKFG